MALIMGTLNVAEVLKILVSCNTWVFLLSHIDPGTSTDTFTKFHTLSMTSRFLND